jgi:Protein of unknown function (DUF4236)
MGLRFQRRIKVFPGLTINLSKSGVGFSAGVRGLHAGIDAKGRRYTSAGLPGTGLSWRGYKKTGLHRLNPPPTTGSRRPIPRSGTPERVTSIVVILVIAILVLVFLGHAH